MKSFKIPAFLTLGLFPTVAAAQYAIPWHSIGGGGGTGGNGNFSLSGSILPLGKGESVPAPSVSVAGGYWNVTQVEMPDNPRVFISYLADSGKITVYWPSQFTTHILYQNPNLAAGNWSISPHPVSNNGLIRSITFTPSVGRLFFRLGD